MTDLSDVFKSLHVTWVDDAETQPIINVLEIGKRNSLKICDFNLNTDYLNDLEKPSDYLAEPIINYEPKLFSLPYRKIVIGTNNVDTIEVDYKYLTEDSTIELLYGFDMTPKQRVFIKGYKGDEGKPIYGNNRLDGSNNRPIFNLFSKPKGKCNN